MDRLAPAPLTAEHAYGPTANRFSHPFDTGVPLLDARRVSDVAGLAEARVAIAYRSGDAAVDEIAEIREDVVPPPDEQRPHAPNSVTSGPRDQRAAIGAVSYSRTPSSAASYASGASRGVRITPLRRPRARRSRQPTMYAKRSSRDVMRDSGTQTRTQRNQGIHAPLAARQLPVCAFARIRVAA